MNAPPFAVALRLARRELRGGLKGFRIFLACLALGVAAIASVQSIASSVFAGLRNDGRAILGGDVAVRTIYREASPEQLAYFQRTSVGLSHFIEMRTMARRAGADTSTLVELKAVDEYYPLFGSLELRDGLPFAGALAKRDNAWGALIDPALVDRLGVKLGDHLVIGDMDFTVNGVIQREPDRAGAGGESGFWPRIMISRAALAATSLAREGSLLYHQYRLKLLPGADPDRFRADLAQAFPDAAWRISDFRNAAPRIEQLIERLNLFLTLVGLTALLVGGVGVSNAVKAYLDTKLDTIATLKCLGAPNRTIFQTYLSQLLVLAGIGIMIGLAIGALAPVAAGWLLRNLLPVPLQTGIYPMALLLAAAFGLLTTLSFAVWPLARAHEIPAAALFRDVVSHAHKLPRAGYILLTLASALLLAGLAIASADRKSFAIWFVLGAIVTLAVFYAAAWGVMRITARLRRPRRPGLSRSLICTGRGRPRLSWYLSLWHRLPCWSRELALCSRAICPLRKTASLRGVFRRCAIRPDRPLWRIWFPPYRVKA
ncbi:MAG: FtsX-like permease family protein [Gammaproteobacteria bacterium]